MIKADAIHFLGEIKSAALIPPSEPPPPTPSKPSPLFSSSASRARKADPLLAELTEFLSRDSFLISEVYAATAQKQHRQQDIASSSPLRPPSGQIPFKVVTPTVQEDPFLGLVQKPM